MLGPLFVYPLVLILCISGVLRPHIGLIGYYGLMLLQPQWNWRWSIRTDLPYQKYVAIATLLGFVFSQLSGNRFQGQVRNASLLLGGFLALAYISSTLTINQAATDFYLNNLWKMVLMTLVAVRVLDSPKKVIACMWVIVLAQGYNAYQINLQYFENGFSFFSRGGWGSSGDNNLYSILTVPLMAVSASLAVYSEKWWQKILAWGIFVLQAHQIMLMESRGCMLGCLVMAVAFIWFVPKSRLNWLHVGIAVLVVTALAGPPVVAEFESIFQNVEELDSSAQSRFKLWSAGAGITMDHPSLGVGPYAGQFLVPEYYPGGLAAKKKGLHNLFFEISAGCGIPALLAYLGFFVIAWWGAFKVIRRERRKSNSDWAACCSLAVVSGLIGYWVSSMFSSGALLESSYICAAMGVATVAILQQQAEESGELMETANSNSQQNL